MAKKENETAEIAVIGKPEWLDEETRGLDKLKGEFAVIENEDEARAASQMRQEIAAKKGKIEKFLKEPKEAAHKAHKAIVRVEKEWIAPFDELDEILRKALGKFAEEVIRKEREIAAATAGLGFDEDEAPAALTAPAKPIVAGTSFRTEKKFRVIDEKLIPRKYFVLNERKIQELVDANGKRAEELCPGIEYYEEQVAVRR